MTLVQIKQAMVRGEMTLENAYREGLARKIELRDEIDHLPREYSEISHTYDPEYHENNREIVRTLHELQRWIEETELYLQSRGIVPESLLIPPSQEKIEKITEDSTSKVINVENTDQEPEQFKIGLQKMHLERRDEGGYFILTSLPKFFLCLYESNLPFQPSLFYEKLFRKKTGNRYTNKTIDAESYRTGGRHARNS